MKKIRILALDIDGCIAPGEGHPADLDVLKAIRDANSRADSDTNVPHITLCTGRQQPYVDLMAQMTGITYPVIFENGAGLYLPREYDFLFHPAITREQTASLSRLKDLIRTELVAPGKAKLQPGKEVSLSVYPAGESTVADNIDQLNEIIGRESMDFFLDVSVMCVNILFPGIDKGAGIRWLAEVVGIATEEIGAVGDSHGDVQSLTASGFAACPANAVDEVKEVADYVSRLEFGDGVVDIIGEVAGRNREAAK